MLKKLEILKQIRAQCEKGKRYSHVLNNLTVNGIKRKISRQTIENWRDKKPKTIGKYIDYCIWVRDEKTVDTIEETLEQRLLDKEASSTEYIFYLCNRRPERWKRYDDRGVLIDQSTKILINVENNIQQLYQKPENEIIGSYQQLISD